VCPCGIEARKRKPPRIQQLDVWDVPVARVPDLEIFLATNMVSTWLLYKLHERNISRNWKKNEKRNKGDCSDDDDDVDDDNDNTDNKSNEEDDYGPTTSVGIRIR
jgi:hypothetical protein